MHLPKIRVWTSFVGQNETVSHLLWKTNACLLWIGTGNFCWVDWYGIHVHVHVQNFFIEMLVVSVNCCIVPKRREIKLNNTDCKLLIVDWWIFARFGGWICEDGNLKPLKTCVCCPPFLMAHTCWDIGTCGQCLSMCVPLEKGDSKWMFSLCRGEDY